MPPSPQTNQWWVSIREARCADAEELTDVAVAAKAFWGYDQAFMLACQAELQVTANDIAQADKLVFVAEVQGQIAGFYALTKLSVDSAELHALFIKPRFMRKGIGAALLKHAKATAKAQGLPSLHIQSDPNAEAFYLAMGAKRIGTLPSSSIPGRSLPLLSIACNT
ncbi:MAG: GNAT family N-acetyltransferase [Paraglaciecola sp.]|nr:GNAT family N-acetyltransferase [Paraglaciecola sp.]NCT48044.1 GNAT family N-acetyltransferase [Paraglaciecola sp.]